MKKPFVVLADLDANYLIPLEDKLTEELYDQIDLEVITSKEYFVDFFSSPRKIDTLIISDSLFSQDLIRHNITDVFVLSEEVSSTKTHDNITQIYKYSSTKEIFNQVLYKNKEILNVQFSHKETEVIVVTSAIGGSGKTTMAMALSQRLSKNHKRVLFISTDVMQGFSYYLNNKTALSNSICTVFNNSDDALYNSIKPYFRHENNTYLPPFGRSVLSIGLTNAIYNRIVKVAKDSKDYDYIVVDTDMQFDEINAELIQIADKVIINILQDSFSTMKTEYLLQNINCKDAEKFIFVCNKFRRDMINDYIASPIGQQFIITEYIEELPFHQLDSIDNFSGLNGIRNLAYIFS